MKTTMKILPLMLGIMLFFTQCEKEALDTANTNAEAVMDLKQGDCTVVQTLWAGAGQNDTLKGTDVGTVTATVVGNTLYVDYNVTNGWTGVEYHLWVGKRIKDIPRQAAPGRFPFSGEASYVIDLGDLDINYPDDPVYIAAHAVVANAEGGDADYEALQLPEDVDFSWVFFTRFTNPVSYFEVTIDEGSWLTGVYEGWCADSEFPAGPNPRSGTAYSSYDITLPWDFDKPENLPLINWVINYDFVGKASTVGGNFTLGDVQRAIWLLLWESPNLNPPGGVGSSSAARVAEILEMAMENGEDFMPGCGEFLVLVIIQDDLEKQPVLIKTPVPCQGGAEETAWAFGEYTFIGEKISNKWGWIFEVACD